MKPLQLKIVSQDEAIKLLSVEHKWDALVSIGPKDPDDLFQYLPPHCVHLSFNDLTPWEEKNLDGLATAADVLKLVCFGESLGNWSRVLIHCGAGCCRSTAAAMVLLVAVGWTDCAAVEAIRKLKGGGGIPNGWLLKLADAMFGTDLFGICAKSGNTKWTPPWLRDVAWCDPPERKRDKLHGCQTSQNVVAARSAIAQFKKGLEKL